MHCASEIAVMSWCTRWSVTVLPKPRSETFRIQIQEFKGSISAPQWVRSLPVRFRRSQPGQSHSFSGHCQPGQSHPVLESSKLSTWEGAVPFGPGDAAEALAYFSELWSLWCLWGGAGTRLTAQLSTPSLSIPLLNHAQLPGSSWVLPVSWAQCTFLTCYSRRIHAQEWARVLSCFFSSQCPS